MGKYINYSTDSYWLQLVSDSQFTVPQKKQQSDKPLARAWGEGANFIVSAQGDGNPNYPTDERTDVS